MKLLNGLRNTTSLSILICCILVTALNQYVTHNNAQVWLSGDRALRQEYQNIHTFTQMQLAYAHATETLRHVAVVANSEKARAEKAEYDCQRVKDDIRRLRIFQGHLANYANYLFEMLSQTDLCPQSFEDFMKKSGPLPADPA